MSVNLSPLRRGSGIMIMYPIGVRPGEPPIEPEPEPAVILRVTPLNVMTGTQVFIDGEGFLGVDRVTWNREGGNYANLASFTVVDDEFITGVTASGFPDGAGLAIFFVAWKGEVPSNPFECTIGSGEDEEPPGEGPDEPEAPEGPDPAPEPPDEGTEGGD